MKTWQLKLMRAGVAGIETGSRHAVALLRAGIDKLEERSTEHPQRSTFSGPSLVADDRRGEDKLDEVGEESFPASDPPASW
jgi:hypothetical protein